MKQANLKTNEAARCVTIKAASTTRQRNGAASDMAKPIVLPNDLNGQSLTNEQILLLGATALGTIRTGRPPRRAYDKAQVAIAEDWLFYWSMAVHLAKTKAEFVEVMGFLLYP